MYSVIFFIFISCTLDLEENALEHARRQFSNYINILNQEEM
jgi:hypothetical protein